MDFGVSFVCMYHAIMALENVSNVCPANFTVSTHCLFPFRLLRLHCGDVLSGLCLLAVPFLSHAGVLPTSAH